MNDFNGPFPQFIAIHSRTPISEMQKQLHFPYYTTHDKCFEKTFALCLTQLHLHFVLLK